MDSKSGRSTIFCTNNMNKPLQKRKRYVIIKMKQPVCLSALSAFAVFKGYFKGVMDDGIEEDEIEERVRLFIDDLDIIVKALASELQGYDGYFKQKREKNDKKQAICTKTYIDILY